MIIQYSQHYKLIIILYEYISQSMREMGQQRKVYNSLLMNILKYKVIYSNILILLILVIDYSQGVLQKTKITDRSGIEFLGAEISSNLIISCFLLFSQFSFIYGGYQYEQFSKKVFFVLKTFCYEQVNLTSIQVLSSFLQIVIIIKAFTYKPRKLAVIGKNFSLYSFNVEFYS